MQQRLPTALFLCVCVSAAAYSEVAAQTLSRAETIRLAMSQNPQVAASRAREAQARARGQQVDAARFPEVILQLAAGPALQAELVPGTAVASTESSFGDLSIDDVSVVVGSQLNVVQPLYTFGKIDHREKAAQHDLRARKAQTRMTRAEVALEAARLYEGLLFAQDAAAFLEDTEHNLEGAIGSTQERMDGGDPDVGDRELLELETAKSFARLMLNRSTAAIRQAKAGLRAYLGLSEEARIEAADVGLEPIDTEPLDLPRLARSARANRPELLALREGAVALEALADAEDAGAMPDLFALGFLSAAYTPGRDWVSTRYVVDPQQHVVPGLLLGVRWAWQAGWAGARAAERRAEAAELSQTRSWALSGISAEVQAAFLDAERARRDIAEAGSAAIVAKRWVVMALADNAVGLADSRAVVDSVEAYSRMRVSHMDAKYRYNLAMAQLASATGTLDAGGPLYPGKAPAGDVNESDSNDTSR